MINFDAIDVNEGFMQRGPSLQIYFLPIKFLSFVVFVLSLIIALCNVGNSYLY